MPEDGSLRIGVYVCSCGANIGSVISPAAVADYAARLDDVVLTRDNLYMCGDPGQNQISRDIIDYRLNRVVIAACSVRMHEPTFRTCVAQAGLNPFLMEMVNIREQDTWVHAHDPAGALVKAKGCELPGQGAACAAAAADRVLVTKTAMVIGAVSRASAPRSIWAIWASKPTLWSASRDWRRHHGATQQNVPHNGL